MIVKLDVYNRISPYKQKLFLFMSVQFQCKNNLDIAE